MPAWLNPIQAARRGVNIRQTGRNISGSFILEVIQTAGPCSTSSNARFAAVPVQKGTSVIGL
jgi:hypothetical protein